MNKIYRSALLKNYNFMKISKIVQLVVNLVLLIMFIDIPIKEHLLYMLEHV